MAFADPQTVTIATVATALPRTSSGTNAGAFTSPDGTVKLTVSSSYGKRNRRTIRLDFSKIAADPFVAGQNNQVSMSAYIVVDVPKQGFTLSDETANAKALIDYLSASSNARLTQLLGGEN